VPKTIIVPLDGSEFAERALAPAAALAKRTGAEIIVMTSQIGGVVVEPSITSPTRRPRRESRAPT
jgi:nucleotide-binding universal stress UspA family protein